MVEIKQEKRKEKKKKQVTRGHNIGWASSSKRKFEYLCFCHCVLVCLPVCVSIHLPWLSVWHHSKKNQLPIDRFCYIPWWLMHCLTKPARLLWARYSMNDKFFIMWPWKKRPYTGFSSKFSTVWFKMNSTKKPYYGVCEKAALSFIIATAWTCKTINKPKTWLKVLDCLAGAILQYYITMI